MDHYQCAERERILQVVGRLAQLRILNGAAVPTSERRDAELRYLRRVEGASMPWPMSAPRRLALKRMATLLQLPASKAMTPTVAVLECSSTYF